MEAPGDFDADEHTRFLAGIEDELADGQDDGGMGDAGGMGDDVLDRADEDVLLPGVDDLPLFASLEARKVDADVKHKEEDVAKLTEQVADMAQRLTVMKEHFKNVQQELDHTNVLFNAKSAEIQTEKHLRQLTSRALGRSQSEKKTLVLDLERVQDELSVQGEGD